MKASDKIAQNIVNETHRDKVQITVTLTHCRYIPSDSLTQARMRTQTSIAQHTHTHIYTYTYTEGNKLWEKERKDKKMTNKLMA